MTLKSLPTKFLPNVLLQPHPWHATTHLILWVVLVVWSYLKGAIPGVQGWGIYFWLIDYSEGFIKRGFLGTILEYFGYTLKNVPWGRLEIFILILHTLVVGFTITILIKVQRRFFLNPESSLPRQSTFLLSLCWLLFACTQFWPTLAYGSGYVDSYLLAAYVSCFYLFSQRHYIPAAAIGFISVLIHEAFIFLWLSIVAIFVVVPFLTDRQINRKLLLCSLVPFLAVVFILLFHDQRALISEIRGIPQTLIDRPKRRTLIQVQFGQTFVSASQNMLRLWTENWINGWVALLYYTWPALLMITSIPLILEQNRNAILRTVFLVLITGYLPISILLVAWDLSRFLVWANLGTILSLTYFCSKALTPQNSNPILQEDLP